MENPEAATKVILKDYTKFTGVFLVFLAQVFSCEFCNIFKNSLFTEYLWTTSYENLEQLLEKLIFNYSRPQLNLKNDF